MRAAAIQLTATPDTAANLVAADRLVRAAAADGATLVLLPEKWSLLGRGDARRRSRGGAGSGSPGLFWSPSV